MPTSASVNPSGGRVFGGGGGARPISASVSPAAGNAVGEPEGDVPCPIGWSERTVSSSGRGTVTFGIYCAPMATGRAAGFFDQSVIGYPPTRSLVSNSAPDRLAQ